MHRGMFFAQPADGPPCPEAVEAFGTRDVCVPVERAVAGKDAAGGENGEHLPEGRELVWDEVDSIAEEGGIGIAHVPGEIVCLSLDEIGFCPYLLHPLLGTAQRLSRGI